MKFPIYTVIYGAAATAFAPFYMIRGLKSNKYLWSVSARLGLRLPVIPAGKGKRVWLHALSLGEVLSVEPLVKKIRAAGYDVCLSTTTRSGADIAAEKFPDIPRFSLPLDLPSAVRKVAAAVNPDIFVLMETDVWPNLLAEMNRRRIPAVLVNARLSPRSFSGYRKIKKFWGVVLNQFTKIGCQTNLDYDRLRFFTEDPNLISITGNLKYDRPEPETGRGIRRALLSETGLPEGFWIAAGSTHPGEEDILLNVYKKLSGKHDNLKMMIAPRNKARFDSVWKLIGRSGLKAARRSEGVPESDIDVFLLDTLGELDRFYELGDVVFVGKSLPVPGEGGGHNLLEPAVRKKPVLFGPRMHNFPEITKLLKDSGGGIEATDAEDLTAILDDLLSNPEKRTHLGLKASQCIEPHRGALQRTFDLIESALTGTMR